MGQTVLGRKPGQGWAAYLCASLSYGGRKVVASGMGKDRNFYAAVQIPASGADAAKIAGYVVLIEGMAYKILSEVEGPYYYKCPAVVLDALSPTSDDCALRWRANVRQVLAEAAA